MGQKRHSQHFERVERFKYLGATITADNALKKLRAESNLKTAACTH